MMSDTDNTRREFLEAGLVGTAAMGFLGTNGFAQEPGDTIGLPKRPLGRTGINVSILCLGGWHIGSIKDDAEAIKIMHAAIDEGMTFFDNAWDYHDGHSEELMGQAMADGGRRDKVFLMTKNCGRDAKTTRQHLEDSLRRLKTDHIDLWQFHEINYDNDPEWIVEKGALAEALKAQKEGKVRFLGFTGHKSPHIHLKMMPVHAWDASQMPINVCDHFYRSFEREVVPVALQRGVAVIGMKSLGGGKGRFVEQNVCTAEEAIRYALSQPIASLVIGIDSMDVLKKNVAIARNFKPIQGEELQTLLAKVRPVAGDGRHEHFKSTQVFDGPYHRKQHELDLAGAG
jgi:aryl-alcohol dehydrogenase-like predicted oxidoreductase